MPDPANIPHPEDRFLSWVDELVDPATAIPAPDPDLADVAGTAAFVQRAAGIGGAPSLSTDRTEALWEEIMHTTAPTVTPTLPAGNGARPIAPRPIATDPAPGWRSYAMIAALIATIVVAGIATAWRVAGPFDLGLGGDGPDTAHQPGIAGTATPTTTADGCPLTGDMLVVVGDVSDVPRVEGRGPSAAVVEPNGDFIITCGGVDDPEPLITGITNATPLQWPGTVLLDREDGSAVAINVATGEQAELGDSELAQAGWPVEQFSMRWLITPNNRSATDWRFTNLETMVSFTLADELSGLLKEGRVPSIEAPYGSAIAVISFKGRLSPQAMLAPGMQLEPPPDPESTTLVDVPAGSLVVDSTLQTRRWIDTRGAIAVSPDGATVAYQTQDASGWQIRIEDVGSGDKLAALTSSNFVGTASSEFAFDGNGDSLVYLDGNAAWIATWDSGLETTQVEHGDLRPQDVRTGYTPDHVLLTSGSDAAFSTGNATSISILDTRSGLLTDVDGVVVDSTFPFVNLASHLHYVVTVTTTSDAPAQKVMNLVDLHTGETVLSSEPIPDATDGNGPIITYSGNGAIAVVNMDRATALYFNANTNTVATISTEPLSSIEMFEDVQWFMAPSNDGRYLYAFGSPASNGTAMASSDNDGYFSMSLLSSKPNWAPPVNSVPQRAILGIPADDASDEPAVLEAQEFATPAPVATASPVAETGCDLDADIPVVTGLDAGALDRQGTTLVLSDGTLSLTCDAVTSVVAEGVTEVIPGTTWPGAVLLHMGDGSLRGVNLRTGAEGDFGDYHDRVLQQMAFTRVARWMLVPTTPEQIDWHIIDLEMMDSLLLSDTIGGVLPQPTVAVVQAMTPKAVVIGFPGTPVLPQQPSGSPTSEPSQRTASLPSAHITALVFDGSLDNRRWIETSRAMRTTAAISPDGDVLAYSAPTDTGFTVRVERLPDGTLVARTGIELGGSDTYLVLSDGGGLLHLAPDRLDRVTWNGAGETTVEKLVTFNAPLDNPALVQTTDPDVVIVGGTDSSGESVGYIVDTASGEITEVPGMLQMPFSRTPYNDGLPVGYVLAAVPAPDPSTTILQLIDVTTGQPVTTSEPLDIAPPELAMLPAALPGHGAVGLVFLADGRTLVLDAETGEATVITPPGEAIEGGWRVTPSPNGDHLAAWSMSGGAAYIRETTSKASWSKVPEGHTLFFVPGAGEVSESGG